MADFGEGESVVTDGYFPSRTAEEPRLLGGAVQLDPVTIEEASIRLDCLSSSLLLSLLLARVHVYGSRCLGAAQFG